ncbi:hypothetical protein D3C87_1130130 [compost metagenome]
MRRGQVVGQAAVVERRAVDARLLHQPATDLPRGGVLRMGARVAQGNGQREHDLPVRRAVQAGAVVVEEAVAELPVAARVADLHQPVLGGGAPVALLARRGVHRSPLAELLRELEAQFVAPAVERLLRLQVLHLHRLLEGAVAAGRIAVARHAKAGAGVQEGFRIQEAQRLPVVDRRAVQGRAIGGPRVRQIDRDGAEIAQVLANPDEQRLVHVRPHQPAVQRELVAQPARQRGLQEGRSCRRGCGRRCLHAFAIAVPADGGREAPRAFAQQRGHGREGLRVARLPAIGLGDAHFEVAAR